MGGIPYRCPKCIKIYEKSDVTKIVYDYRIHKIVCAECGSEISSFVPDYRPELGKYLKG